MTSRLLASCRTAKRRLSYPRFTGIQTQCSCRNYSDSTYKAKKTSALSPTLVLLGIMPICTFALGTWQLKRLKWKVGLIDELQEKLQRPPMSLPSRIDLTALPDFSYQKVLLRGRWDHAKTILVGPRVRDGTNGYNVVTPLVRDNGSTILVDRGFVSEEHASVDELKKLPSNTDVEVLGMLRMSGKRNRFTPDNHPEKGEWYWVDLNAMADYAGGESAGVQPVFVEEIFEGHSGDAHMKLNRGEPIGRLPSVDLRNQHASYVVTWYALSVATGFMFVHLMRRRARAPAVRMPRR